MSSSSLMIRCLGCMLITMGTLFELSSGYGSGDLDPIKITVSASDACDDVKTVVDAALGTSTINLANHDVEVDQESCYADGKRKRNVDKVYDVYMVEKGNNLVTDDAKTHEVRIFLCEQCDAIKTKILENPVIKDAFKSISCDGTDEPDCVATIPPAPSSPISAPIPAPSTSDSVIISSNASISISKMPVSTSNAVVAPVSTNTTGISVHMNSTAVSTSTGIITPAVNVSTVIATAASSIITTTSSIVLTTSSMTTTISTMATTTSSITTTTSSVTTTTSSSSRSISVIKSSTKTIPPVTVTPSQSISKIDASIPASSSPAPPTSDAAVVPSSSSTRRDTTSLVTTASPLPPTEGATDTSIADTIIVVVPATVLGAVVIVSIAIICMMFMVFQFKRIRYERNDKKKPTNVWIDTRPSLGNQQGLVELKSENVRPMRPSRVSFMSKGNVVLQTLSHPLSVDELAFSLQNLDKLVNEYMNVPSNLVTQNEIPVGAEEKNRYIDVLPNPNTRVPLFLKFGVAHSDYINANYIRGHRNQPKQYIATQGPLEETVIDFWRMVWEQKVTVVIMATELVERNMEKCVQYWPDAGTGFGVTKVYGEIEVTMRKRNKGQSYTVTTFSIAHLERHVTRELTHYWFNGWPDHGVPNSATELVDFLLETRTKREGFTMPGPTLVHCSAGIGRTGVFIATDIGMRQLEENMTVDVLKTLATLRQDKGGMVQTKEQYIFIHKALKEYASRVGTVSNLPRFDSDEGRLNAHNGFYDDEEETVTTFA